MQRFEFDDGTSRKFWQITAAANQMTVRFGRIGANGQTQTKAFADAGAAQKERDRLIKEKTSKGYAHAGAATQSNAAALPPTTLPPPAPPSIKSPAIKSPG